MLEIVHNGTGHLWYIVKDHSYLISQHKHKITDLWKFGLNNWWLKLRGNIERKNTLIAQNLCTFRFLKKASGLNSYYFEKEITCFSKKKKPFSKGAVSHNDLYYLQFSITRYQVSVYAYNYFTFVLQFIPKVSSAFKKESCVNIEHGI